jgi:prolyl-tRNA synthetase
MTTATCAQERSSPIADSDLMGIPLRVVVSEKTIAAGKYECVERATGSTSHRTSSELVSELSG